MTTQESVGGRLPRSSATNWGRIVRRRPRLIGGLTSSWSCVWDEPGAFVLTPVAPSSLNSIPKTLR